MEICVMDFAGTHTLRWSKHHGGRGGGGGGYGRANWLAPGRGLWGSGGFVGAQCENQRHKESYAIETFKGLRKIGDTVIPMRIQWNSISPDQNQPLVYNVKKVRFANEPSEAWFVAQLNKHFPGHVSLSNFNYEMKRAQEAYE